MAMGSRELAYLRLVASRPRGLGWHEAEVLLSTQNVPFEPSAVELGRRLEALGLLVAIEGRHQINDDGRRFLRAADDESWPLGPAEAAALTERLAGSIEERLAAVRPFASSDVSFVALLRQLLYAGRAIDAVAWLLPLVGAPHRIPLAFAFATDLRAEVRAALWRAWGGPGEGVDPESRFKPPGALFPWENEPAFAELVCLGLDDESFAVRDLTARVLYLSRTGGRFTAALVADLRSERPSPWSAAALGTAHDAESRAVLLSLLANDALAPAAVRGLAQRADGHAAFIAAFSDVRPSVVWMAEMGLGYLASELNDIELARIQAARSPQISVALSYYRARL
jgi:hypothetical protein